MASTGPAKLISTPTVSGVGRQADVTGKLEVVEICYKNHAEQTFSVTDEQTGKKYQMSFAVPPAEGHLTGERVRVRGRFHGEEINVPTDANAGLAVLAAATTSKTGLTASPKILYGGGTNANTVIHRTLVELLIYSDYATNAYTAASILSFSNEFFSATGNSVNNDYLEDTYGAVGFAGDVVICNIADTSGDYNTGTWMSQGDAAATAQGYNLNNYAHHVYITSGAGGWAGLAAVGGNWSMDFYTDGGTICHELGHNLGFNHASTQWNNTSAWNEYGDGSDFMGANYEWQHNDAPHKVQLGWLTAQTVTNAGTYQISRIEDVPATVPYPQVLTLPSSSSYPGASVNGWPYYFSYRQNLGFDTQGSPYNQGLSIHRWGGGSDHTAVIAVLADGGSFTDSQIGLTVSQISHDTNSVTVVIVPQSLVAQPFTFLLTSEQLAARTPVLVSVAANTGADPLTVTNFDALSAKGGTVALTNNQLLYTPPGVFTGNDTFNYTVTDMLGTQSSSVVTIVPLTQPHYNWDANGATAGTGGSGTWNISSLTWDNGVNHWPGTGTTNWALFGGTAGTVSIASGGVTADGLAFRNSGYILQNNGITLNGSTPTLYADSAVNGTINSIVAGTAGLTKTGLGSVTLGAANTVSGAKTISQGTLWLANVSALPAPVDVILGDTNTAANPPTLGVSASVTLNTLTVGTNIPGATWAWDTSGGNVWPVVNSTVTLNSPLTITKAGANWLAFTMNNKFTGNGGGAGNDTLVFDLSPTGNSGNNYWQANNTVANNFSGNVHIKSGTLSLQGQAGNVVIPDASGIIIDSGAALNCNIGGLTESFDTLSGGGTLSVYNGTSATFTIGGNNGSSTFNGVIANTGGGSVSLVKAGTGTLTLAGANTYTGTTTISKGTLSLNNGSALSTSANVTLGDANTGTNTPTLNVISAGTLGSLTVGAGVTNATFQISPSGTGGVTFSGGMTLNSALRIVGSGGTWGEFAQGGKMTGAGAGAGNDTLMFSVTSGSGYWEDDSVMSNDFSGNVHIQSGEWRLQGQAGNVFIPDTAGLIIDSGATLKNNTINNLAESFDSLSGGGTFNANGYATTLTVGVNGGSGNFGGVIASSCSLVKTGGGTQTLSGVNTYSGGTTLSGGRLNLNNASAIGTGALTISGSGALDNTSSADLTLANNAQNWNANFTYVGSVHNLNLGSGAVTLGTNCIVAVSSNTLTVGGAISGGYGLTKTGAGTLVLGGANNYSGATTVGGGTLNLLGTLTASPTITVSNTGTLNGSGTYNGAVAAGSGGTVAALNNALFTLGSLTLGASGSDATTLNVMGNGTAVVGRFAVNGSGGFVVNGTAAVNILGALPLTVPSTNIVLSYTGARGGTGGLVLGTLPGRATGYLVDTGSQIQIVITNYTPWNLRWAGTPATNWDNSGNLAWNVVSNGASAAFFNGDAVTFDDTAATFGVNLAASVTPGGMTVNAASNYTIGGAGSIAGSVSLTKKGSGTLTLGSANSYSGGTVISNGTVAFASGGLGGGVVTLAGSSTLRWIGNNSSSVNMTLANGITATLDVTSNNVTQSSALSGVGAALVKTGAGTLALNATNTFSGGVTINAGTLSLNNAGALNSNSVVLNANNVTLQAGNYQSTAGPVTVAGGLTNVSLVADNTSATTTTGFILNGIILNSPLTITYNRINGQWDYVSHNQKITGAGGGAGNDTLIFVQNGGNGNPYYELDGHFSNDFTGNVHVKSGSWSVQGFGSFIPGSDQVFPAGSMLILDDGTIWTWNNATAAFVQTVDGLAGSGTMSKNAVNYTLTINAINANNGGKRVFSGSLSGLTGTLTLSGTGKQSFAGSGINYANVTAINNGTLSLSNCPAWASAVTATSPGVLDLDGDAWSFGKTVSGTGGLSKSGTGTVTLTASQSNTGTTAVNGGTLLLGTPAAVPPVAGMAIWLDAADATTVTTNVSGQISAWANKGVQGGSFTMATTANRPTYVGGGAAFNSKPVVNFASASSQCLTNLNVTDSGAQLQVFIVLNQPSTAGGYAGMLSFENSSDPNDWQNATSQCLTDDSGGNNMIVQRGNGYAMSTANGTTYVADYCYDGANMYGFLNGSKVTTAGSSGSFEINYAAIGGRFGGGTSLGSYWNGRIAEILVYTNVLTAAQRQGIEVYLGQKWVGSSYGIVSLNNASAVSVAAGATLGGVGAAGTVTVQSGGKLAPGLNGIGTLTLNATPALGGTTQLKISKGASPNADQLVVSGHSLAYGGTLTVTNIGTNALTLNDTFTLFSATGYTGNFTATNLPALGTGLAWNWTPANGTLAVVNSVNTSPTNLVAAASGGNLNLSWPADHTGWRLLVQTNNLAAGISANTNDWMTVPGSSLTNQMSLPMILTNLDEFYRLVYP